MISVIQLVRAKKDDSPSEFKKASPKQQGWMRYWCGEDGVEIGDALGVLEEEFRPGGETIRLTQPGESPTRLETSQLTYLGTWCTLNTRYTSHNSTC